MKEIALGTIGSGFIVDRILDAVERTEGVFLAAVYSRSLQKGRALADRHGGAGIPVYTSLEEMLQDPQVNTVYVASPNTLHYDHCRMALEHGKHVICEKPFCPDGEQVRALLKLAEEKELFLVDATPTAFLPNFEILKSKVSAVGRIRLVLCNYSQYSSRYDQLKAYLGQDLSGKAAPLPNVFNPAFAGGSLMDINYYNIYFMVSLFGKPGKVIYYPNLCESGVDTSGIVVLIYPDFVCQGSGAKDTWGVNSAQIEGEQGYIHVADGSNGIADVKLVTKEGTQSWNLQTEEIPGESNRWYYEIRNLVKMMLADDRERSYAQTKTAADVMDVICEAREQAGLSF